jgi:hypothetical protein
MSKEKLVGMICKERLQTLEENPPCCPRSKGIKKVLTPYKMKNKFIILSPDGFSIHPTNTYTEKEITTAFVNWKSNYQDQGYYSSVSYGKIPDIARESEEELVDRLIYILDYYFTESNEL